MLKHVKNVYSFIDISQTQNIHLSSTSKIMNQTQRYCQMCAEFGGWDVFRVKTYLKNRLCLYTIRLMLCVQT